jgi:hypothetical protein
MDNMKRVVERQYETDLRQFLRSAIPLHIHFAARDGRVLVDKDVALSGAVSVLIDVPVQESEVLTELLQRVELREERALSSISDGQLLTVDQIHSAVVRLVDQGLASEGSTGTTAIAASLFDSFSRRLS